MSVLEIQSELLPLPWQEGAAVKDGGAPSQGEVFTRPWVVELVLDLAGYLPERDLVSTRAIEPACGAGAFLVPMVHRLSRACRAHGRTLDDAADSIFAVDVQPGNAAIARKAVKRALLDEGWGERLSSTLAEAWVHVGDFILAPGLTSTADFVLGNPPYVRLEDVAADRSAAYRRACQTMGGRADLFIAFYEMGLRALRQGGVLGYICADRWMHNQYGRGLRALIGKYFSVDATVVMHDVDAFEEEVSAYPAVTVIRRGEQGPALVADTTASFGAADATRLVRWAKGARDEAVRTETFEVASLARWHKGADSWPAGSPEQLALVADLEARFPPMEDAATGTRVGIGVATGADGVFVTTDADLVEEDRLLPLAMVRDTKSGTFEWSGHYLIDPWADDPAAPPLVDLEGYPRLRAHFEAHGERLRGRHIAERRRRDWYRTIDRVDHALTARAKLLFPDLKMAMRPVYEGGGHYPHHNLYYVVSDGWPLDVLGGLLLSRVADLFVRTYSVKMRGGTLRFQAQYLRRICLPPLVGISGGDAVALSEAFEARDIERATGVAERLYGIEGKVPGVGRPAGV